MPRCSLQRTSGFVSVLDAFATAAEAGLRREIGLEPYLNLARMLPERLRVRSLWMTEPPPP